MMERDSKIYVAGHSGMVGSALVRRLRAAGFECLLLPTHQELDLTKQDKVEAFFRRERPRYVFVAAGLVGGIRANSEAPADFFSVNMAIAQNVILSSHAYGVEKLLYLGSACMYPANCRQPMGEDALLTDLPEVTNEGYALAKICGCRLCSYLQRQYGDRFISTIPANAYGLHDSFDPQKSHVIPALIAKFHRAKMECLPQVELWGSGRALREFLYTEDLADGCIYLMEHCEEPGPINMGSGEEVSMQRLAEIIRDITGYEGEIVCDASKPDGMARRMVDSTKISQLGWQAKTSLQVGLNLVYQDYLSQIGEMG